MSEVTEVAAEVTEIPAAVTDDQNTAQVEQTSAPTPDSTEAETTKPPETEEQKRSKYQRRIDRKNAEIAAARTEARLYRERLEALEAQRNPQPQVQRDSNAPRLEQFDNFEDFLAARDEYVANKVVKESLTKAQKEAQERKAAEEQGRIAETWQERQQAAADKYPDFEEVVSESDAPITSEMGQAIVESDLGADIAYYLAQHPDEAKRIARLSPIRQIAEIGKLESKVSAPPVRKPTSTPPPVNPIGTKAKAEKNPDEMPVNDWLKWRNEQLKNR